MGILAGVRNVLITKGKGGFSRMVHSRIKTVLTSSALFRIFSDDWTAQPRSIPCLSNKVT